MRTHRTEQPPKVRASSRSTPYILCGIAASGGVRRYDSNVRHELWEVHDAHPAWWELNSENTRVLRSSVQRLR